jgi:hypothetical protein
MAFAQLTFAAGIIAPALLFAAGLIVAVQRRRPRRPALVWGGLATALLSLAAAFVAADVGCTRHAEDLAVLPLLALTSSAPPVWAMHSAWQPIRGWRRFALAALWMLPLVTLGLALEESLHDDLLCALDISASPY